MIKPEQVKVIFATNMLPFQIGTSVFNSLTEIFSKWVTFHLLSDGKGGRVVPGLWANISNVSLWKRSLTLAPVHQSSSSHISASTTKEGGGGGLIIEPPPPHTHTINSCLISYSATLGMPTKSYCVQMPLWIGSWESGGEMSISCTFNLPVSRTG